jgi:hypothetical protein
MLDPVRPASGLLDTSSSDRWEPKGLTQGEIDILPSVLGPVSDPQSDSTARIDRAGYIYLWEVDADGAGFWVQAGYVRNGRQRFGQVIDPDEIRWFELAVYKKKVLRAKKSLNSARLPAHDDIWDATNQDESNEAFARRWAGDSGTGNVSPGSGLDNDPDMI